jgi:hypothetical protein
VATQAVRAADQFPWASGMAVAAGFTMPDHANSATRTAPDSAYEGRQSPEADAHDPSAGRGPATGAAESPAAAAAAVVRRDREVEGGGAPDERG